MKLITSVNNGIKHIGIAPDSDSFSRALFVHCAGSKTITAEAYERDGIEVLLSNHNVIKFEYSDS